MKKHIIFLIAILIILSFTAFGYIQWIAPREIVPQPKVNEAEFFYAVGPRFESVTKAELANSTTIFDFLDDRQAPLGEQFESVTINVVENEWPNGVRAEGYNEVLTDAQRDLLLSASTTHFSVRGEYHVRNKETGELEHSSLNPYLTIVPEKQAGYSEGNDAFLSYLRSHNRKNITSLESDQLRPAKLYFTVAKDGSIKDIRIGNHSGYPTLDKIMINLLKNAPGQWIAAKNLKGEKVDQELVISYGLGGC